MKFVVLILLISLSGCSIIAAHYDSQDPCQQPPYPQFCGASDAPKVIEYDDYIVIEKR